MIDYQAEPKGSAYQAELDEDLRNVLQNAVPALSSAQWAKLSIPRAKRTDWRTPAWLVKNIIQEFKPDLDVAADSYNSICENYLADDNATNALKQSWYKPNFVSVRLLDSSKTAHGIKGDHFTTAFCNPPFDKCIAFLQKALQERANLKQIVMLLPYRAGSKWFRDLVFTQLFTYRDNCYTAQIALPFKDPSKLEYWYGFRSVFGELRILTKRLAFDDAGPVAAFDCCIVVFYGDRSD